MQHPYLGTAYRFQMFPSEIISVDNVRNYNLSFFFFIPNSYQLLISSLFKDLTILCIGIAPETQNCPQPE